MTVVNTETGEIVELLDRAEAERLTTRIRLRLDTIADNYVAVMPLIREAIERQAYAALGYSGVSQYVSECFGDALAHLGVEVRREVVRELTAAGMSTRAIAPVIGMTEGTVRNDLKSGAKDYAPAPGPTVKEIVEHADDLAERFEGYEPKPEDERPVTVGIDGKKYTKKERDVHATDRPLTERIDEIRALADKGASRPQIAKHFGVSEKHIAEITKAAGITTATELLGRRRRFDHNRVLDNVTEAIEVAAISLRDIDPEELDREGAAERLDSLTTSINALSKAVRKIKESFHG